MKSSSQKTAALVGLNLELYDGDGSGVTIGAVPIIAPLPKQVTGRAGRELGAAFFQAT